MKESREAASAMEHDGGDTLPGFPSRAAAERAALDRPAPDNRPLYVCKDNNGRWHITSHPEYYKDAFQVKRPLPSAE